MSIKRFSFVITFLMVLALVQLAPVAQAATAYLRLGAVEFLVPIDKNIDAVGLFDAIHGDGMVGGETALVRYNNFDFNGGAVTSFLGEGTPYASLDYDFAEIIPFLKKADVGLFYGYDFNINESRAGWKVSIPLE